MPRNYFLVNIVIHVSSFPLQLPFLLQTSTHSQSEHASFSLCLISSKCALTKTLRSSIGHFFGFLQLHSILAAFKIYTSVSSCETSPLLTWITTKTPDSLGSSIAVESHRPPKIASLGEYVPCDKEETTGSHMRLSLWTLYLGTWRCTIYQEFWRSMLCCDMLLLLFLGITDIPILPIYEILNCYLFLRQDIKK